MKKLFLVMGVVAAQAFTFSAFAQGEVGGVKKAAPYTKVSPEDKAAAKATRRAEGAEALKQQPPGEVGAVPSSKAPSKLTKEEKAAARSKRKAEASAANKAGKLDKTGEGANVGVAPK